MIRCGWTDHFDAPDFSVLDEKRLGYENARRPIESSELIIAAVRENALVHSALIEDCVRPHNPAFTVDDRVAAIMDALNNEVISQLELRQAVHCKCVDRSGRFIGRPRDVCRR